MPPPLCFTVEAEFVEVAAQSKKKNKIMGVLLELSSYFYLCRGPLMPPYSEWI